MEMEPSAASMEPRAIGERERGGRVGELFECNGIDGIEGGARSADSAGSAGSGSMFTAVTLALGGPTGGKTTVRWRLKVAPGKPPAGTVTMSDMAQVGKGGDSLESAGCS